LRAFCQAKGQALLRRARRGVSSNESPKGPISKRREVAMSDRSYRFTHAITRKPAGSIINGLVL
jgi:hypothetical protein